MKPVWDGYFADPDVIRTPGGYFAFGTGGPESDDGQRTFPALRSDDLLTWTPLGGSLEIPEGVGPHFWAPEVIYHEDRYLMVYSAGGAEGQAHQLRVAIAAVGKDGPELPFTDTGRLILPRERFSIDGSPFRDPASGETYLFFAKDYLDGEYPGTGLAVAKLSPDLLSLATDSQPILRASADWQLFERERWWYERLWTAWYTVEGPFCVYRGGRYWLFYSGGRWEGPSYGVGVAVSDSVTGPYVDPRVNDGPSILSSKIGLRGPGHNSIVTSADGTDHICFHAWNEDYTKRQMYIEPLSWDGDFIPSL